MSGNERDRRPESDDEVGDVQDGRTNPEPEGGPLRRLQDFMADRFTTPHSKDEDDEAPENGGDEDEPPPADQPGAVPMDHEPADSGLPEEYRQDLMREYRRRQREKMEEEGEGDEEDESGPPTARALSSFEPEPPVPPPANNWIPIGPSVVRKGQVSNQPGVSGRMAGLAVTPGATRVYGASANGGVWRSDDQGQTWRSTMDAWDLNPTTTASDSLACGAIVIDPTDSDRVFVGSGEGASVFVSGGAVFGSGAYFGVGPIFSPDGGVNWQTEPSAPGSPTLVGESFYGLAIDPDNTERVVGATTQGLYRREPDGGGGFRWSRTQTGIFSSVVAARSGGTTTFYAAESGGGILRSDDGQTWANAGAGFPAANIGRIGLGLQTGNRDVVYALIARADDFQIHSVWRLDDGTGPGGGTWRQISGHPTDLFGQPGGNGQGWYDLAVAVDPNDVNRIYLGGSTRPAPGLPPSNPDRWSASLYRCVITSSGAGPALSHSMSSTAIGATVHADVHALTLTPGSSDQLWVGCDGGVFLSNNASGGAAFQHRNTGLQTLTMEHLADHPTEDAVVIAGTQDNGSVRFTGEKAWLHFAPGDGGYAVINWADPYRMIVTYPFGVLRRYTDGGQRYTYTHVFTTGMRTDSQLFYAPMAGTPPGSGAASDADRVAYGTNRPWITDDFGNTWGTIPNNTSADALGTGSGFRIRSLAFASPTRLYAGTMNGRVFRYDEAGGAWTRTRIDNLGGANALPSTFALPVTDIAVDPADATGSSLYITFGGISDYRRVWRFDGTGWQQRSGPAPGSTDSLLNVQHNAIAVDPDEPTNVYTGADIGCWRSRDAGATWQPFSEGLPDAAIFDLKLHGPRRLLRASTHGRSVFERSLDSMPKATVELYVRDTQLDQGRFPTSNGLPDPTQPGQVVRHWRGPDIKVDTPDSSGDYQFPLAGTIDFFDFVDTLDDDFQNVATHGSATIATRVYVQVHNRGVVPANDVQVMLLLANASAGLPPLPGGYEADVQAGNPINNADWETIDIVTLQDMRVGFPKVASFTLTSDKLPPPSSLAGNDHHCVLALVHSPDDAYTSAETSTDLNSVLERKAAHKNLKVVPFIGTLPAPPYFIPIRLHNALRDEELVTNLVVSRDGYRGRLRVFTPPLRTIDDIEGLLDGMEIGHDFGDFKRWSSIHRKTIDTNQRSEHPYNKRWSEQRLEDIELASQSDLMFEVNGDTQGRIKGIVMEPGQRHTVFLMIERPADGKVGERFEVAVAQEDREGKVIGSLETLVEIVPEPEVRGFKLEMWTHPYRERFTAIRARLLDINEEPVTPDTGVKIDLTVSFKADAPPEQAEMRYHRGWHSYWYLMPGDKEIEHIEATAHVNGVPIAEGDIGGM